MGKGDTHVKKHNKGANKRNLISNDLKIPKESEGEMIGQIIKPYGSCRFGVKIVDDEVEVQATATRSFKAGPTKEIIKMNDYVVIQPGISAGQYFINHKYTEVEINKLYDLGHIGKPKVSVTIDESDVLDFQPEEEDEIQLDDIWDL